MGRKISEDLFQLIRSMTGSEKRYFKIYAKRHVSRKKNNYSKLFDAIGKQKNYDEEKLLKNNSFIDPYLFPDQKNELYWQVLRSLTSFHSEKTSDSDLRFHLNSFDVLFAKGLHKQCRKIIERIKDLAKDLERAPVHLECLDREKKLEFISFNLKTTPDRIKEINIEIEKLLARAAIDHQYSKLSERMFMILNEETFIRSEKNKKRSKEIINDPIMKKIALDASFNSKYNFLRTHSLYSYSHTDFKGFYHYCKQITELLEPQRTMIKENPKMYVVAVQNLLIAQKNLKMFDEFFKTINQLRHFETDSEETKAQIFAITNDIEVTIYIDTGQFAKGTLMAPTILKGFERFKEMISPRHISLLYFNTAYCFFGSGNYKRSLNWLNRIINMPDSKTTLPLVYNIANILTLLVHYELGHTDLLDYRIRSLTRSFRNKNEIFEMEEIIFKFLSKAIITHNKKDLQKLNMDLYNDINTLHDTPGKLGHLHTFDFLAWAESKATGKSMSEIVGQRHNKQF